jgi:hypothetical protein
VSFLLLYLFLYFFMHPIDSHHNTTFFLKLTGSNISSRCYFLIDFCLNIFISFLCLGALLYTSCVLGLRPSALFNEFLLIKKKNIFRNMLSDGFQHSVRQRALWKTDQCWNHVPEISNFRWAHSSCSYRVFRDLFL